jgi:cytochrome P450
LIIHPI